MIASEVDTNCLVPNEKLYGAKIYEDTLPPMKTQIATVERECSADYQTKKTYTSPMDDSLSPCKMVVHANETLERFVVDIEQLPVRFSRVSPVPKGIVCKKTTFTPDVFFWTSEMKGTYSPADAHARCPQNSGINCDGTPWTWYANRSSYCPGGPKDSFYVFPNAPYTIVGECGRCGQDNPSWNYCSTFQFC